ncbi:MAG: PKD domain-containing protein [Bacteroidales bacterium]|nr:PKD domain-containing protein [Bacteroidales bacterium]
MKKVLFTLFLFSFAFFGQTISQERVYTNKILKQKNNPLKTSGKVFTGRNSSQLKKTTQEIFKTPATDTLNFPLEGNYVVYTTDYGYVSGNNEYDDKVKANFFEYSETAYITGALFEFAVATNSAIPIEIGIWDNTGTDNSPGTKIGSSTVSLDNIFIDVLNEQMTYVHFDNPVEITPQFYVGAVLPTSPGDTLVVFSNSDGDTDPATAWDQWSDNTWYPFDHPDNWELQVAHAIFPIITTETELIANFTGSPLVVESGQNVQFTDLSVGNPVTWEWTFEGGDPAQSNFENPEITYPDNGEFDVTLIVSDGETNDTLTKYGYITVVEEIPPDVDTLLFPLPGNYVVFTIINGGGYVCGTNGYGDLAKANYFYNYQELKINGVLFDFAWAEGGNPNVELAVWADDGPSHAPGTILQSQTVPLNTIKENISNQEMTYIELNPPVETNQPFYAGFFIPESKGDTIVCWSNDHEDINPGIAWDLFSDGVWHRFNEPDNWALEVALAIHPIVEYQTGIYENDISRQLSVLPNPTSGKATIDLSMFSESANLTLYSVSGEILKSYTLSPDKKTVEIDLTGLDDGIYLVKITSSSNTGVLKIIKN